jgi:hypothetical protein
MQAIAIARAEPNRNRLIRGKSSIFTTLNMVCRF